MVESIQTGNIQLLNQITKKAGIEQKQTDAPSTRGGGQVPDEVSLSSQSDKNIQQLQYLDRQLTKFSDFLSGNGSFETNLSPDDAPFKASPALNEGQINSINEISKQSVSLGNESDVKAALEQVQSSLKDGNVSLTSLPDRPSLTQFVS